MSSLMYVACEMSMYLMCKMHFWWDWTLFAKLTLSWWEQGAIVIDMHKKNAGNVLDKLMWSNVTFGVVATCTRTSVQISICIFWPYPHVMHMVVYPWWSFGVSWVSFGQSCKVFCVWVCVCTFFIIAGAVISTFVLWAYTHVHFVV